MVSCLLRVVESLPCLKVTKQHWVCCVDVCAWPFLEELIDLISDMFNAEERYKRPRSLSWVSAALTSQGKTTGGCLAEAIQCLLLSNFWSFEKLTLTLTVEYCLSISSLSDRWNWWWFLVRHYWAYLCHVLGLALALPLWICIKWIHFHIHLRFPHFWLLFWRSGFSNKGIEREGGAQFLLYFFLAYDFILWSAFFSSLFKMSEFDLDLLAATSGNGLRRTIWAGGWGSSAIDAICTWPLALFKPGLSLEWDRRCHIWPRCRLLRCRCEGPLWLEV